ncbi:MAG: phospho-sugar mutase [Ruminococcaceae bacterium]|nr:phospho-sugar mutase [Oscillospiraceae bacterium]
MAIETLKKELNKWLNSDKVSAEMKDELKALADNEEELKLRFSAPLSFGTAGLRGTMAAGIGKMNVHTVAQATKGLSDYILAQGGGKVAIAYDTRINSELFARISAEVLAYNGISSYIFDGPRPTPELSFALRELNCIAGINVTASHNPKEYNGYKVYWSDGAQIGGTEAKAISENISKCDIFEVEQMPFDDGVKKGLITVIGDKLDEKYMENVLGERVNPNAIKEQSDMTVVYTPLHGAGYKLVPEVLRRAGIKNVIIVPEQGTPNGEFPTVRFPNPEFPEAFELGKKLAIENGCDFIIATDPDADRMGITIRNGDDYLSLTGNQVGCLLLDYIITAYRENGGVPSDAYAVKSIVSTELASLICKANGVKMHDVLTGFKYIGEVIKNHEKMGFGTYLLGFEESYGYLKGTYARDKDAVVATLLVTEMAAYYRSKGMTLKNALDSLYERYGNYNESGTSFYFSGSDGKEKMTAMMSQLRNDPPKTIAGEKVLSVRDYLLGTITDLDSGKTEKTGLPSSNVLYYTTESCVFVIRPSGTEPKIKLYFMAKGNNPEAVNERLASCKADAEKLIKA